MVRLGELERNCLVFSDYLGLFPLHAHNSGGMSKYAVILMFVLLIASRTRAQTVVATEKRPIVDEETARLRNVIAGSKKVQKILKQAESGTEYRISFVMTKYDPASPYQGYTTINEGSDKKRITVHIAGGVSRELIELLASHELFHIVLQKQGWPSQAQNPLISDQERDTTFQGAVVKDATAALMNCYPDALIDRWMSQRGFTPKVINRREYQLTVDAAKTSEIPPPQIFPLWRRYVALVNYCLSIRARDFEMKDVFKAYERVDPEMAGDQSALEQKLGTRSGCNNVRSCLEATKKLRHAAGFDGQIKFLNPLTNKWE